MAGRLLSATVACLMLLGASACGGNAEAPPPGGARPVAHAMGVTEITGKPARVVVLDTGELDSVLALGVTPVGAVRADDADGLQDYLADRTREIELVGTIRDPNLETIAALRPDLILSNKVRHEQLYPTLSRIAPTVFAERVGVAWRENLELAGRALGMPDQAARLLAEYREQARRTGRLYGDPAQVEVSMIRFVGATVRLYGEGSFVGTVLADAGFARPPVQRVDRTFVEISQEQLGQAEGDRIFYSGFGTDGQGGLAAATAGPLWPRLPAVAGGRAHEVSDDLWYLGIGPIAAARVLDELGRYASSR